MPVKAAFVGATGATLSHLLAWTLLAGHRAAALVRDQSKLRRLLVSKSVPETLIDANLVVIEATSSRSVAACIELLRHGPEIIFSGITAPPKYQLNPFKPVSMQDPTVTGDSAKTVIEALRLLQKEGTLTTRPIFAPISSTGQGVERDQPLAMKPLYWWLLRVPQADTAVMEQVVREAATGSDSPLAGYVMIRPPLLVDGPKRGLQSLRVGWTVEDSAFENDNEKETGVTVGYTVGREDLANWMFEELVEADATGWNGKCVTLTY
ncbi:hypothetical protein Cob_v006241 [Colletotrichum orbiculare MAFF 240422]|uniref:Uncharacterized protein n=1 Tax=Colletotrichum orbiculare (strain 104-T / ATCC 96160 / CBS 514.97 / LARS 414 / MAFF 240422) TaxID=1213857 RepID=N4VK90_COLOR|nr:hypothetical protein Cob_v006241 [Colletotrichum orbiculare MAFF 240422]